MVKKLCVDMDAIMLAVALEAQDCMTFLVAPNGMLVKWRCKYGGDC